ncbi:MAG TPA: hypothetical protein VLM05_16295 [Mycobacteriales bacterium]|nr:hypothetical protein [Mycobacteriales bacterium]
MSRLARRAAVVLLVIGVLVTAAAFGVRSLIARKLPTAQSASCDVTNSPYTLSTEQAANAATISAVATSRKLPGRAATVALATALQESKLVNVEYGDRDSVGLFQQRPSQGWGSQGQIMDPRYAAGKFYDALVKVRGWQALPVAQAAQAVQQSGHPTAYQQWEDQAGVLARAFAGAEPAMLSCSFPEPTVAASPAKVLQLLALELRHTRISATAQVGELRPTQPWATAGWLVAKADRLGIEAVALDGRRWTRTDGWRLDPAAAKDRIRFEVAKVPPSA